MLITEVKSNIFSLSLIKQGDIVEGINHINQCITILLQTRKGSDALRPEYGCDIFLRLDKPMNTVKGAIINDVISAINIFIPEIKIINVTPSFSVAQMTVSIQWTFANETDINKIQKVNVNYGTN